MATKFLLLSCLLTRLGIAQHPVSEGNQTQDVPTFTVPAGFKTSTDPPLPPEWDCVPFTPEDIAKGSELSSRVDNIPLEFFFSCLDIPSPKEPECEPVHEYWAFIREKCPGYPADLFSNNLGIRQYSVSEKVQAHHTPTITVSTDFATSTPPSSSPLVCKLQSEDVVKLVELGFRIEQMPKEDRLKCSPISGSGDIPDYPECGPVQEFMDFMIQKCLGSQVGVPLNVFEDVNEHIPTFSLFPPINRTCELPNDTAKYEEILSNWWEMPIQDAENCSPEFPDLHIPDYPECEPVQELMDLLSCLSRSAVDWSESHRRHNEADICVSRLAQGVSLGNEDSDEPYDPDLKPFYDFCDVLEDPDEHTMCVLAELERAFDLLDEIFDTDDVVPVADDDELPRHPQVSATSEATEIARLIEKIPFSSLEKFSQECERAVGYVSLGHCVSEKMRDEVCSSNPGSEICEVPRAAFINERDLPLYTKTIDSPLYTETININS